MAKPQDDVDRLFVAWDRLLRLVGETIPSLVNRLKSVRQKAADSGSGGPTAS